MKLSSSAPVRRAPDLVVGLALFLAVLGLYFVSYTRLLPDAADEMLYYGVAESIVKAQVVSIDQVSTVGPAPEEFGVGGHRFSKKGPLHSLLAVPLLLLAQRLPIGAVDTALLLNHIVSALVVALLFLLLRRLGYSRAISLALSAVLAFSTPLWVYAKGFFAEPTIALCVLAALYAAHAAESTGRARWLAACGLAFGLAVAAKNVNAILLLPVPLYLAWLSLTQQSVKRCLVALCWFALGVLPSALLLMLYSYLRYGTPFSSGYGEWETFSTPIWEGIAGILFSPGKSIVVYTPLFLLLPFWTPAFLRRFHRFGLLVLAVIALHLLLYGSWHVWWGAWGWGSRFTVAILPLLVLLLAEGMAARHRSGGWALVIALGALGVLVQALGVAVNYGVYLGQLMALDLRPDILTLYDLARSPILNQIPLLSRQWLDFAWVRPDGTGAVDGRALGIALAAAAAGLAGLALVWRADRRAVWLGALCISFLAVGAGLFLDLRYYYTQGDAAVIALGRAIEAAPPGTAVLQMTPKAVVPYSNWQKRPLPELGWTEEPRPDPIILARLREFAGRYKELWVVTDAPAKAPGNGVEAELNRSLAQVGAEVIGPHRLLRYVTGPDALFLLPLGRRFGDDITLAGFAAGGPAAPGKTLDLTLKWQAGVSSAARQDYTVFVHLVGPDGTLVAQHDGPPGGGLLGTAGWQNGQVVYDHHAIAVPAGAPAGLRAARVGLYLPANGNRVPVLDAAGNIAGDFVTIDLP